MYFVFTLLSNSHHYFILFYFSIKFLSCWNFRSTEKNIELERSPCSLSYNHIQYTYAQYACIYNSKLELRILENAEKLNRSLVFIRSFNVELGVEKSQINMYWFFIVSKLDLFFLRMNLY